MKLGLCIVGCGSYARTVLEQIHDMTEHLELFFASRDLKKARKYRDMFGGAGAFGDYCEAAEDPRVQALYFITPHHLHLEGALLAARHSKHILMEKPIARTMEEGRAVVRAAKDAGVKLMVAENYRFLPTVAKCKELLAEGRIGDLRLIRIHSDGYAKFTSWRADADQRGGGGFIDGGIHAVDLLVNLGGYPERVYATTPPRLFDHVEGEDGLVMIGRLPGARVGLISYSSGTPIRTGRHIVYLVGSTGELSFVPYGTEVTLETPRSREIISVSGPERGTRSLVREFRDAILEDREPLVSGDDGLRDLSVVLAAYQSVAGGQEVEVTSP